MRQPNCWDVIAGLGWGESSEGIAVPTLERLLAAFIGNECGMGNESTTVYGDLRSLIVIFRETSDLLLKI